MTSKLFGSSKPSPPIIVAEPPTASEDTAAKEAATREAERIRKRRKVISDIATSEQGITTPATTLKETLG